MGGSSPRGSVNRRILARQWQLLRFLGAGRGLPARELAERLGVSRPTVTRDLATLRDDVGVIISRRRVNGEIWHSLEGAPLQVSATPAERAALQLAHHALRNLAGTRMASQLAQLEPLADRDGGRSESATSFRITATPREAGDPEILRALERALEAGQRIRIEARVASRGGELRSYDVDPLAIRLARETVYLDTWAVSRDEVRTFKVARITTVEPLKEPAADHPDVDLDALFSGALKTWSDDVIRVRVRLSPEVAWAIGEYPLSEEQLLIHEPDGAMVVEASVAGLVEVSRWVLSWGRHAEALEPRALRERMAAELADAAAKYGVGSRKVNRPELAPGEDDSSGTHTPSERRRFASEDEMSSSQRRSEDAG